MAISAAPLVGLDICFLETDLAAHREARRVKENGGRLCPRLFTDWDGFEGA